MNFGYICAQGVIEHGRNGSTYYCPCYEEIQFSYLLGLMKANIGKMLIWLSSVPNLSLYSIYELSVRGEHSIVLLGSLSHQLLYKTSWTLLTKCNYKIPFIRLEEAHCPLLG